MTVRLSLVLAFLGPTLVRADDSFTKGLTPAELHAAGLDKLTPAELEQLDALVRARQSGAVANAKDETTRAVTAQVRQQVKAEETTAAQRQAGPAGFLDRM
ncbi:MAG TPA: hypothetical protein VKG78_11900, partial [Opitutaceae bacterium]|nr:hypothetical protein [Opitutaceae bacterium]